MSDKYLKGPDILLNLKEVDIHDINAYSSSSCSGPVSFYFEDTTHGCMEDPDLTGKIKVLSTMKNKKGHYILEVVYEKETVDY